MFPDIFLGYYWGGHRCSHNAWILSCVSTTRSSRTWFKGVGMFHRPLLKAATHHQIHCAQHVQISADMSIQLPVGLQCDPVQIAEVVQQEYVLVGVNVPTTVHLSKHHSYCLHIQNRGRRDRSPDRHLIADDIGK